MLRFIFFKGLYSTLDLYTDEMLRICRERGYEAFVLHTTYGEDTACEHIDEKQEKAERETALLSEKTCDGGDRFWKYGTAL